MKQLFGLILAGFVTACGVDGEPIQPSMSTTLGVGSHGVHTSTHVGASVGNGNVNVGIGLGF